MRSVVVNPSVNARSLDEINAEYDAKYAIMTGIIATAKEQNRDLTEAEARRFDSVDAEIRALKTEKERAESDKRAEAFFNSPAVVNSLPESMRGGAVGGNVSGLKTRDGKPLASAVGPKQRLSRKPTNGNFVGELVRAAGAGVSGFTPADVKAVLTSDENSLGGFSVPTEQLYNWIDRMVEPATMLPFCTRYVMGAESSLITTVESRPTAATKAQLDKFIESGITFGQRRLEAFTAGSTMLCSLELLQDSPNAAEQIERVALRGLVDWFDRTMVSGSGNEEPYGLLSREDLPTTENAGDVSWKMVADAVTELRKQVYVPNVILVSPAIYNALFLQRENEEGDGMFLSRPGHLEGLPIVQSTYMPDTKIIVADLTQLVVGFRENPRVEVSATAGESFERNAVTFRLKLRCDWVPVHRDAFRIIDGVTLPAEAE